MRNPLRKRKVFPKKVTKEIANSPIERVNWGVTLTKGSIVLAGSGGVMLWLSRKTRDSPSVLVGAGLILAGVGLIRLGRKNIEKSGDRLLMACLGREKVSNRVAELYREIGAQKLGLFIQGLGKEKIQGKSPKERNQKRKKLLEEKRDKFNELLLESKTLVS